MLQQTARALRARALSRRTLSSYSPPSSRFCDINDLSWQLHSVPHLIAPFDASMTMPVLEAAENFVNAHGHLDPLFDVHESKFEPARISDKSSPSASPIVLHPETKSLLDEYVAAGFTQMQDPDGMDLPYTLTCAVNAVTSSAFTSGVLGHWTLTQCAANLLAEHGSPELVSKYHAKLIDGSWTGTMALSETQAGSSLLEIRTKATPTGNPGEYKIKGAKMWTSGADHGMYDNVIHMLLAKTEAGISLFLVPKNLVNDDGSLGARNDYEINGVNHKMGCRGLANCYWSLGDETGGATGYLIGEEGKGLNCMFFMMNEMRIHVGIGAAVCGKRGLQESLTYAVDRIQGRRKQPNSPPKPIPIIEHNDVKRMLLQQKAYSEGAMMLCLFAASLSESSEKSNKLLLEVLIPLVKSWPSEWCLEANKWAIQVLGGYGFTRDFPLEQIYRDNRLNMIHEGTAGIQSLDLLGRKTMMADGAAFKLFLSRVGEACERHSSDPATSALSAQLASATEKLADTTLHLVTKMAAGEVDEALASSHDFLNAVGHVAVGWMWIEQAGAAAADPAYEESHFLQGKVLAAKYFYENDLSKVPEVCSRLRNSVSVVNSTTASHLLH
ncbi:hypothetical protein TrST_g6760 [Triparma strigata]|uniref:Acyl-CoA dehydrogenase n=1 Tax=Triparma strigata TaxID=1606541 RepID=A0A9W7C1U8_9STRA|nr:hypothetical protein TrST_g6760 [Triparma strigata]